jgi:hypothetical protein
MAYYQSFLLSRVNRQVDGASSSDTPATPNYSTDELESSTPATSIGLPECSPLRCTMTEINMGVETDAEQASEDPESQTSVSSATFDRLQQTAFQSLASSQGSQASPQSQPQEPPSSLQMGLDIPWEDTVSSQPQTSIESPNLLFIDGSSAPPQHFQRHIADSVSHQKRVLDNITEEEGDMEFQSSCKRPRRHQDASEYDADDDDEEEPNVQDDEKFNCPCCPKKYGTCRALTRHRRSISPKLLKCLDLSAGPLDVFFCSEPGCKVSSARLDAIRRHVTRAHHREYNAIRYSVETLRKMMENLAPGN